MRFEKPVNVVKGECGEVSMRIRDTNLCIITEDTAFYDGYEIPENRLTVGELFLAIKTALDTGLVIKSDMANFYSAFANCADQAVEASQRMEQVVTVFNAEPYSMDIQIIFYPELPGEDFKPPVATIDKSECGNYTGILKRVFMYPHNYAIVDGVLQIAVSVSENHLNKVDAFAKALVGDLCDFHRTFEFWVLNDNNEPVPYRTADGRTEEGTHRSFSLPVWHSEPQRVVDLVIDWFTLDAEGNPLENPPCITRFESNEANKSWSILFDTTEELEAALNSRPLQHLGNKVFAD